MDVRGGYKESNSVDRPFLQYTSWPDDCVIPDKREGARDSELFHRAIHRSHRTCFPKSPRCINGKCPSIYSSSSTDLPANTVVQSLISRKPVQVLVQLPMRIMVVDLMAPLEMTQEPPYSPSSSRTDTGRHGVSEHTLATSGLFETKLL